MTSSFALLEISRIPWNSIREVSGPAEGVSSALSDLLAAPTPAAAEEAYWRVENHVVVQGQLFEAAEYVVPVLVAALIDERPRHVRLSVLELLFQILSGQPDHAEVALGNGGLAAVCRAKAREGLWTLYREMQQGEKDAAFEVISLLEEDRHRFEFYREEFK